MIIMTLSVSLSPMGLSRGEFEKRIRKLFDYIGDTFGDLTDSLPLAGKEFNAKKFQTEEQLYAEGRQALIPNWSKLIFGGENYIESTLEDAGRRMVSDFSPVEVPGTDVS